MEKIEEEQIKKITDALYGLDYDQWSLISNSVDMYFNKKITKLELDDKKVLYAFLNRDPRDPGTINIPKEY
ncbi:hypothetical protein [Peptostreptococcus equinus]|uniref:Uncharacterized protein n=1 Tax=Peptostreptococcus equinus TaxID=3003601 RepID=A0ABY7JRR7_9FIRM|nr:hypothetical protein [Peptostreptococcus sp. CBA3647]WAW14642.1 hypothetical protein O0R46_08565 [Peptostreptococcus sp. CBA3647]